MPTGAEGSSPPRYLRRHAGCISPPAGLRSRLRPERCCREARIETDLRRAARDLHHRRDRRAAHEFRTSSADPMKKLLARLLSWLASQPLAAQRAVATSCAARVATCGSCPRAAKPGPRRLSASFASHHEKTGINGLSGAVRRRLTPGALEDGHSGDAQSPGSALRGVQQDAHEIVRPVEHHVVPAVDRHRVPTFLLRELVERRERRFVVARRKHVRDLLGRKAVT